MDGLRVEGLGKQYGDVAAVRDLSFTVPCGEIVGLLGPNGAGKTTTLHTLAGLVHPTSGRAYLDGMPIEQQKALIGFVPEQPEVFPLLTVEEHLGFVARAYDLPDGWQETGKGILRRLHLEDVADRVGGALSKGMKQKLLIACALLHQPKLMLVDEPMVGLDPAGQRELVEALREIRSGGAAILLSTHMLQSAEEICDRVVILRHGRLAAQGTLGEITAQSQSLEEAFLGLTEE
jgi:ABC-2 type transport system ATP-binding protein